MLDDLAGRDHPLIDRIKWTTFARTLALTVLLLLTIAFDLGLGPQPLAQTPEVLLYQLESAFFVLTFCALLLTYLLPAHRLPVVAWLSMAIDIALAGALVVITDRTQSVLVFALPLAVLSAAALLERRGAFVAATVTTALALMLSLIDLGVVDVELSAWTVGFVRELGPRVPPTPSEVAFAVVVQIAAVYATALLASKLVSELSRARAASLRERGELIALRQRHQDVFASMPDGLMTVSADRIIRSVNPALCTIVGQPRGQLEGRAVDEVLPELQQLEHNMAQTQEIARGSESPGEVWRELSPTKRQILAIRTEVLRGGLSERHGQAEVLYVVRDISELRARELAHRNRERLAGIGAMAMAVAHEIRNPLAAISGAVQMIRQRPADLEGNAALMDIITRETDQLTGWIGQFLEFARPAEPAFQPVDLAALVRDKIEAWRHDPRAAAAAAGLRVTLPEDGSATLVGDHRSLASLVWNLLINAQQAVAEADTIAIAVSLRVVDRHVELSVEDSGYGVPPADRSQLFEPFFTTRTKGTGLGLATVRRAAETHRGEVSVEDSALGGARFVVRLPLDLRRHADVAA